MGIHDIHIVSGHISLPSLLAVPSTGVISVIYREWLYGYFNLEVLECLECLDLICTYDASVRDSIATVRYIFVSHKWIDDVE